MKQDKIAEIVESQMKDFLKLDDKLARDVLSQLPLVEGHVTIVTGVKSSGKTSLLLQMYHSRYRSFFYCNFEDLRLMNFTADDFALLYAEIKKRDVDVLYFDEIQLIDGWSKFIRQLQSEFYRVFVVGSSASLLTNGLKALSKRYLSTIEIFPFSFREFISNKGWLEPNEKTLKEYLQSGGMPDYVKSSMKSVQSTVVDGILRDIVVRNGLRDALSVKQLALHLFTRIGSFVSANMLLGSFGIKSATTMLEYFSHFSDAYLLEFMPQLSNSEKVKVRNPKKVYVVDTGLITTLSDMKIGMDKLLENLTYIYLRRQYRDVCYFKGKGECDFVVREESKVVQAVQVCADIKDESYERKISGLLEVMDLFNLSEGTIVTMNQTEVYNKGGQYIRIVPAYDYMF